MLFLLIMQPQTGYGYNHITGTATGTAVVFAREGVLHSLVIPASKTGTISVYDSATGAGTASTNLILTVDNTLNAAVPPTTLMVHGAMKNGLTVVTTGTTDVTVMYN